MRSAIVIAFLVFCAGCRQKSSENNSKEDTSRDTISFFQVTDFFDAEIKEVNQTPFFIYAISVNDGKKDSAAINNEAFNRLVKPFLQSDINDPAIKKNYTENVFHDQTTKSYTLSYTTLNKELPVQRIDVLLHEDAQTVKRIFIRRFFNYGDSTAMEQLSWKTDERFQISRVVQLGGTKEISRELTVVWNNKE